MPAVHAARPSRRGLLTGATAAGLVGGAAALAGDDAEILRLFAEWLPLQRRYCELDDETADITHIPAGIDDETRRLIETQHDLAERIADLRASTMDALRAKAVVLLSYSPYEFGGVTPLWTNHDELLGWSLARDLAGDQVAMSAT